MTKQSGRRHLVNYVASGFVLTACGKYFDADDFWNMGDRCGACARTVLGHLWRDFINVTWNVK